ncbi:MAG: VCBS repeat-containing protein [Pseudomonadota bacterium]
MMRWTCAVLLAACVPVSAVSQSVIDAQYAAPTTRYAHGVLGDTIEHGALVMTLSDGTTARVTLPTNRVFEDTEPRVQDLDGDGVAEVIVVESDVALGARLVIYGADGEVAATPHIGRSFRWLAPVGAADLDGDGVIEIAYVDRPHLAKRLTVWRYQDKSLELVATLDGVTNHRIGEVDIAGGIRNCGEGPEMIVATANWTRLNAVRLEDGTLVSRDIGVHEGRPSFVRAMNCP